MTSQLLQLLNELAARIKKNTAVNVNSQLTKQAAIDAGTSYFKNFRQEVLGILSDNETLQEYDQGWQQLIRLAQGSSSKATYQKLIKKLIKITNERTMV